MSFPTDSDWSGARSPGTCSWHSDSYVIPCCFLKATVWLNIFSCPLFPFSLPFSSGASYKMQRVQFSGLVHQPLGILIKGLKLGRIFLWHLYQSRVWTDNPGSRSFWKLSPVSPKGQCGDMGKNQLTPRPALYFCVGGVPWHRRSLLLNLFAGCFQGGLVWAFFSAFTMLSCYPVKIV